MKKIYLAANSNVGKQEKFDINRSSFRKYIKLTYS